MKLLILVGGTNTPSNSDMLADWFIDGAASVNGTVTEKIYVRDLHLDQFMLAYYDQQTDQGAGYERLKAAVEGCDGLIIATPIWNFSVPGHLKNLIDRMGAFGLDADTRSLGMLKGKPVYFIF